MKTLMSLKISDSRSVSRGAYGAVRVMVACNQTGEAAGTAAVLSMRENVDVDAVNPARLRLALEEF